MEKPDPVSLAPIMRPDALLRLIRDTVQHPATARELMRLLRVPRADRARFTRQLKTLAASGELVQVGGNRFGLPDKMDLVVGRLQTTARSIGFVAPEHGGGGDVYVAPEQLADAVDGDRVVARVEHHGPRGRQGRIIRVLERRHATLVGRFEGNGGGTAYVAPFDRHVLKDVHVPPGQIASAKPGEMVVVEITQWPTATRGPAGRIVEVLGFPHEPGVDTKVIIRKYDLPDVHSDEALEEARRAGGLVREKDIRGRTDFRDLPTVTIDGEHARDFDDAITIDRPGRGHYRLGVHIADVAHYVREGSALDEEAYERGTSVYFTERAVHMFPEALATGLCSLNPHVDRLVQSCVMDVDRRGQVVGYEIHDGVIRSNERMTYTAVNAILEDRDAEAVGRYRALVPAFELMRELYEILRERRRRRGSIDFDLPEAEVRLSAEGAVEAIIASERNVAHRIIEEFMLLANETVAAHLVAHGVPALHRVHEPPDPAKVADFEEFIAGVGYGLGPGGRAPRPADFQRLVERIRGRPEERPIATLMLRTMQKARYDAASLGHFGLAADHYVHFTSPIRRYPDLVVHRMLREARYHGIGAARRDELAEELPEAARHASERERRADDAERELLQWKKVRFMADRVGDEYKGFVTGVAPFGLFVELIEHFVEGLVHVSSMADDYYRFVEERHELRGEHTKKTYRLGDAVVVQVVRVDMDRRQIDFGLTEILERVRREGHGAARSRLGGRERRAAGGSGRRGRAAGHGRRRPGGRR
jgi:ribonuclease R